MSGCPAGQGDGRRPLPIEWKRVERVDRAAEMAVVALRGWARRPVADGGPPVALVMWRLVAVVPGVVLEARRNGSAVPVAQVPGVIRDVAVTATLDALGKLAAGWPSSAPPAA